MRRYLFTLAALAALASPVEAASRFWVLGTGTWDASDTTHWSATSGGAGGASVPGSGDSVTFDANSGGGTVTAASSIGGTNSIQSMTTGAFTGTLDFATNNPSITFNTNGWSNTGTATRTINCGTGTFSFSGTNVSGFLDWGVTTNLTLSCAFATFAFSGNTINQRSITLGNTALTYPSFTVAANTSLGSTVINGTNATITAATFNAPNYLLLGTNSTFSFTTAPVFSGTSSSALLNFGTTTGVSTITSANAILGAWTAVRGISFAGGGNATFTNSFDLGRSTISGGGALSITPPTAGGSCPGRIIGG